MMVGMKKLIFKPISGRLILTKIEKDELSSGGIVIPDTLREANAKGEASAGYVVSVGPGRDENRHLPDGGMECKVGDLVFYPSFQGYNFSLCGRKYLSIYESFCVAVIPQS